MSARPRHWNSNKGRVLYAIYKSQNRTWSEIQAITSFRDLELRLVLKELFDDKLVSKVGDSYWIEDYELYCNYRDYDKRINQEKPPHNGEPNEQIEVLIDKEALITRYMNEKTDIPKIVKETLTWAMSQNIGLNPWSEHFFVNGEHLDHVSKSIIELAQEFVLVINPFVDQCSLSDRLKKEINERKQIRLLTRSPRCENYHKTRRAREAYHDALVRSGVEIIYNDRIHSKIILGDDICVVSSMNFKSESSSGKNHEAGLVTWQKEAVTSLKIYATNIINDPETKPYHELVT